MNAVAIRPRAAPAMPFGLRADLVALHQVLAAMEDGHAADRNLDADIYEALGWEVIRAPYPLRRLGWRCRSPLATGWEQLPSPTGDVNAAARIRPSGWGWGVREVGGLSTGWCMDATAPGRFAEVNRLSAPRAVTVAALFAHRIVAMGS
jgi:hypothetical protein